MIYALGVSIAVIVLVLLIRFVNLSKYENKTKYIIVGISVVLISLTIAGVLIVERKNKNPIKQEIQLVADDKKSKEKADKKKKEQSVKDIEAHEEKDDSLLSEEENNKDMTSTNQDDTLDGETEKQDSGNEGEAESLREEDVEYKTYQSKEVYPYDSIYEESNEVYVGDEQVQVQGEDGYTIFEHNDKYINGVKVESNEKVIEEKKIINEVILLGTKSFINEGQSREILNAVNAHRKNNGVELLEWHEFVFGSSQIRAEEISRFFSHDRPNGTGFSTVFGELDPEIWAAGENIAAGHRTVQEVMDAWKNSPGHNGNMLSESFTHMAAAKYETIEGAYWVQLFIRLEDY